MPLSMVTVTGGANGWANPDGTVPVGQVMFQPVQSLTGGGYILAAEAVTASLVNGNISKQLANNTQLTSLQYLVTEQIAGAQNPAPYVITPTGSTLDLSTAPRGTVGTLTPLYVQASVLGQPNGVATLDGGGKVPATQLAVYQSNHPSRHGLLEWNFDPTYTSASGTGQAATAGSVFLHRISAQVGGTVNNVLMVLGTLGATLTTGQNLVGIYDDGGTRIGITADQTATWGGTTGTKTMALVSPATIQAGRDYYVAVLANGTTPPSFVTVAGNNSVVTPNVNLSAAALRFSVNGTGSIALPASVTLANNSSTSPRAFWVGLS